MILITDTVLYGFMCEKTLTTQPNPKPDLNAKVIFSTGRFIIINERIIK